MGGGCARSQRSMVATPMNYMPCTVAHSSLYLAWSRHLAVEAIIAWLSDELPNVVA